MFRERERGGSIGGPLDQEEEHNRLDTMDAHKADRELGIGTKLSCLVWAFMFCRTECKETIQTIIKVHWMHINVWFIYMYIVLEERSHSMYRIFSPLDFILLNPLPMAISC